MNKVGSLKLDGEQRPKLVQSSPDGTIVNSNDTLPTKPDGGWGWMVVLCSFVLHAIIAGVTNSLGVFLIVFIEEFDAGRGDVGWISSLMTGMTFCSGPIVSALINKYGSHVVSIAGSILAASGFFFSAFAPNLYYLFFTLGIVSGFGLGMIYIPSVISVTHYFKKRLSLATGLALCGAGIGTIIFAPLVEALMEEYGWRGAVLIEAGLVLNGCIVGTQLRPLEPKKQQQRKPLTDLTEGAMNNHSAQNSLSLHSSPHTPVKALEHDDATLRRHGKESGLSGNINADRSSSVAHSHTLTSPHRQEAPQHVYFLFRLCHCSEETKGTFRQLIELLKDMTFILFAISEFFDSLGYYVPYFYLIDMVEQVGISKSNAVFLISVIGVSNLIARVVSGWFSDKCVNRLFLRSSMMMLCGISTSLSIFCFNYEMFIVYAVFFGFSIGATTFLRSIVLVDLLGIERITNSFGLLIFFKGMASFIGAPIAGWIYDMTDSYDIPFVITGAVVTFGGFIQYCIPCARKLRDRRRRRRLEQDNVNMEHGLSLSVMDA